MKKYFEGSDVGLHYQTYKEKPSHQEQEYNIGPTIRHYMVYMLYSVGHFLNVWEDLYKSLLFIKKKNRKC